jgi:transcriptional regulator with XRE-family HTH domain
MEIADKMTFGIRLAQVRQSKNISAYQLSIKIGRATNYISSVERGKVNISLESIIAICEELKINPKELF